MAAIEDRVGPLVLQTEIRAICFLSAAHYALPVNLLSWTLKTPAPSIPSSAETLPLLHI